MAIFTAKTGEVSRFIHWLDEGPALAVSQRSAIGCLNLVFAKASLLGRLSNRSAQLCVLVHRHSRTTTTKTSAPRPRIEKIYDKRSCANPILLKKNRIIVIIENIATYMRNIRVFYLLFE